MAPRAVPSIGIVRMSLSKYGRMSSTASTSSPSCSPPMRTTSTRASSGSPVPGAHCSSAPKSTTPTGAPRRLSQPLHRRPSITDGCSTGTRMISWIASIASAKRSPPTVNEMHLRPCAWRRKRMRQASRATLAWARTCGTLSIRTRRAASSIWTMRAPSSRVIAPATTPGLASGRCPSLQRNPARCSGRTRSTSPVASNTRPTWMSSTSTIATRCSFDAAGEPGSKMRPRFRSGIAAPRSVKMPSRQRGDSGIGVIRSGMPTTSRTCSAGRANSWPARKNVPTTSMPAASRSTRAAAACCASSAAAAARASACMPSSAFMPPPSVRAGRTGCAPR